MTGAEAFSTAYVDALVARNSARARRVVDEALAGGLGALDVILRVLQPALYEIGRLWEAGRVSVADEHYATSLTRALLTACALPAREAPGDGRLAVVACTPGELHALATQVVSVVLEADGWEVLDLGADVPTADLAGLVAAERPEIVALSTSTPALRPAGREAIATLRALAEPPFVVVGGQGWSGEDGANAARDAGAGLVAGDTQQLAAELAARFPPPPPDA